MKVEAEVGVEVGVEMGGEAEAYIRHGAEAGRRHGAGRLGLVQLKANLELLPLADRPMGHLVRLAGGDAEIVAERVGVANEEPTPADDAVIAHAGDGPIDRPSHGSCRGGQQGGRADEHPRVLRSDLHEALLEVERQHAKPVGRRGGTHGRGSKEHLG